MRDSLQDILHYYSNNDEDSRLQLQQLEHAITLKLLSRYLPSGSKILELGAGTGRYTVKLAQDGHRVTSVELAPELTEKARQRIAAGGMQASVELLTGDARDLKSLTSDMFDVVLVMGPFYHLMQKNERESLMADIKARTKKNGLIISAHLNRIGLLGYMLARFPMWGADSKQVDQILKTGHIPDHPRNGEFRAYYTNLEEIKELHTKHGLKLRHIHCQDPCIGSIDEVFNDLPHELKERWTEILTEISAHPLALGSGRSLLAVATLA